MPQKEKIVLSWSAGKDSALALYEIRRAFEWGLTGPAGHPVAVRCLIQGLVVEDDRLVIELGLAMRPSGTPR